MLTTFKAYAKKTPMGLQVETTARNFKFILDEPTELGGSNTGMNPVEALLCALGACQTIVAFAFAKKHKINLDGFKVKLEGDLDPDGFLGLADVRKGFQEIRFEMHFKTDASQQEIEKYADFIEATCPVGDCLNYGVKLVKSGVVINK
ncbi:MAG: OsmC family protein [Bacilli bacterium]|nr:OsmC family protein [Bacilli bacterium]MDD4077701.1 OsmC family protein [Bacilli bacterium]MDD4388986.1 OsmC family protein [Bacilli bacterium]